MRDRFNLHLTNKNQKRINTSEFVLGQYSIFTPQQRSKHKSLISMLGGQREWETTLAKVGSTPRDQGGNDGNDSCIDDNTKNIFNGKPYKDSIQLKGLSLV